MSWNDSRGFSPCVYGSVEPKEWLDALYEEMVEHSDDVVTLLIENYVEADHLRATINSSIQKIGGLFMSITPLGPHLEI